MPSFIDDKYEIIRPLGSGMSGEVFLVRNPDGKEVALKFLKDWQPGIDREKAVENFRQEFLILKDLHHPGIAPIYDFGRTPEERYYFTVEYLEGKDFFKATEGKNVLEIEELFIQALRALEYLHARHVLHLDIKPANLLVTERCQVKLIDFGLAGERSHDQIAGTPSFMAPEVILGEIPDGRADLYSLGVVFYEALTRHNPFRSSSVTETLDRQKKLIPPPPSKLRKDSPHSLNQLLERLLEKNRGQRYPTAAHVIRDLNLLSGKNYPIETRETRLSYLPEEGTLIGREEEISKARDYCLSLQKSSPPGRGIIWVQGEKGTGKTRVLKELKYFCQLHDIPICLLDDMDRWSEEEEEHWLEYLQRQEASSLVVVLSSDPNHTDPQPLLRPALQKKSGPPITPLILRLKDFSEEELKKYLSAVTGLENPPYDLVQALFQRTGGNPLFLSEMLKSLLRNDLLLDAQGRWQKSVWEDVGVDFSKIEIPSNLKGLLHRNFLGLDLLSREVLALMALVEKNLTPGDFASLLGKDIGRALKTLSGFLFHDPVTSEMALKNPLWKEVVEDILDPGEKAAWHDKIGDWLEAKGGSVRETAQHRGNGTDPKKAIDSLLPIAQDLLQRGFGTAAIPLFQKILERAGTSSPSQFLIDRYLELGDAYLQSGNYPLSMETFQKARSLLTGLEKEAENIFYKIDVHEKLAGVSLKLQRTEEAKTDIQAALTLLSEKKDDPVRRLILENDLGEVRCQEGLYEKAEEIFRKTWEKEEKLSPADRCRVINNDLGLLYLLKGDPKKAVPVLKKQLDFFSTLPRRYPEARCHYNLAEAYNALQDAAQATKHYLCSVDIAKNFRAHDLLFRAYNGLGNVHTQLGKRPEAIESYTRALAIAQKLEDRSSQAAIYNNLGLLFQEEGNNRDAESHLIGAVRIVEAMKDRSAYDLNYLARAHLELGSLYRNQKKSDQAYDHLRHVSFLLQEHPSLEGIRPWVSRELDLLRQDQGSEVPPATSLPQEKKEEAPAWKDLLKILRLLSQEKDPEVLIKMILHYALDLSSAETGLVLLQKNGELEVRSSLSTGVDPDLQTFSSQIAKRVLENGKTIVTDNAQEDPRFRDSHSVHLHHLRSILALPIFIPGKTLGVLYLDTRFQTGSLDRPETIEILQAYADQVGVVLENARLVSELRHAELNLKNQLNETETELTVVRNLLQEESLHLQTRYSYEKISTRSKKMHDLFRVLDRITETPLAVMIQGETGTGKELIARALHDNSPRKRKPFVAVNCGAIPVTLMESELFGHKAGAFTGATHDKKGLCEVADEGTLFLDEVGELTPELQVKLLRFLQEKEFRRVGETEVRHVDVRVLAATHQDLQAKIRAGSFREDLYFRLCEIQVTIPPLRERKEDIPLLVDRFMENYREEMKLSKKFKMEKDLLRKVVDSPWPGNIRELENFVRVACALAQDQILSRRTLTPHSPLATSPVPQGLNQDVSSPFIDGYNRYQPSWNWAYYEKILIAHSYRHLQFKAVPTARGLLVTPPTIYKKIRDWNLENPENTLYRQSFHYVEGTSLKDFRKKLFTAALQFHRTPYATLRALGVSQGHFYKVIQ